MGSGFSSISLADGATFLTMLAGILGYPFLVSSMKEFGNVLGRKFKDNVSSV